MITDETHSEPEPGFEFLPNEAEEDEGLGNAGIETYRDEPYASAARETGQNTRDAAASLPVRISFDLMTVPFSQLPFLDSLRSAVEACLGKARKAGDEKDTAFFEHAQKVLAEGPLKILRIADSNTTGLKGPPTPGTPFHSLVKGAGVSVKSAADAGGSFGIGKNAVYTVSDLQTVFYSTVYNDELAGEAKFLAQGKAILVSHTDASGQPRRAYGYWGRPKFRPIEDINEAPGWLRRTEVGTSVFAMGFRDAPDWQYRIAYSLLMNFFHAVHHGEMEFAINGGSIVIDRFSLASLFDDPAIRSAAEANDRLQEFQLSKHLYDCLVSADAREDTVEIDGLGRVQIRVLVSEGLPKKVCIIRNGMVITDSLEHFGDKFSRFPMYRDFVALVVPLDQEGRAFIKWLENPKHDGLSAERLPDEARREHARAVMKKLARRIRETIKAYTLMRFESEVAADEMRRYFATRRDQPEDRGDSGPEDPQTIRYGIEPRGPRPGPHATAQGDGESGGPRPGIRPGPGPGPRPGPAPRPRPRGTGGDGRARPIVLNEVRNIPASDGSGTKRTIFFTPAEGGLANIAIDATGLNDSDELRVVHASSAEVTDGRIRRRLVAGERTKIDVELDEPYRGPIELRVSIEPEAGDSDEGQ